MKRSQISLFIIIGFFLMIILGSMIFLSTNRSSGILKIKTSLQKQNSLKKSLLTEYIGLCTESSTKKAVDKIGITDAAAIDEFIKEDLPLCIRHSVLDDQGISFDEKNLTISTNISTDAKAIIIAINYPIILKPSDSENLKINEFRYAIDIEKTYPINTINNKTIQEIFITSDDNDLTLKIDKETVFTTETGLSAEELKIKLIPNTDPGLIGTVLYEITPNAKISKGIELNIDYSDEDITSINEEELSIVYLDNGIWRTIPSIVDKKLKKVKGTTDHFTLFGIRDDCDPNMIDTYTIDTGNIFADTAPFSSHEKNPSIKNTWNYDMIDGIEKSICISSFKLRKSFTYTIDKFYLNGEEGTDINKNIGLYYLPEYWDFPQFGECIFPYTDITVDYNLKVKDAFNSLMLQKDIFRIGKNTFDITLTHNNNHILDKIYTPNKKKALLTECDAHYGSQEEWDEKGYDPEDYPCIEPNYAEFDWNSRFLFELSGNFIVKENDPTQEDLPKISIETKPGSSVIQDKFNTFNTLAQADNFYNINKLKNYEPDSIRIPPTEDSGEITYPEVICPIQEQVYAGRPCNPYVDIDPKNTGYICLYDSAKKYGLTKLSIYCNWDQSSAGYTWQIDWDKTKISKYQCTPNTDYSYCNPIYNISYQQIENKISDALICSNIECIDGLWTNDIKNLQTECLYEGMFCNYDWECGSNNCANNACCNKGYFYSDVTNACTIKYNQNTKCDDDYQCISGHCIGGFCSADDALKTCSEDTECSGSLDCCNPENICGLETNKKGCSSDIDCCPGLHCTDSVCCPEGMTYSQSENRCLDCEYDAGKKCTYDYECCSGICINNKCTLDNLGRFCNDDSDCGFGLECTGFPMQCHVAVLGCTYDSDCSDGNKCIWSACCPYNSKYDHAEGICKECTEDTIGKPCSENKDCCTGLCITKDGKKSCQKYETDIISLAKELADTCKCYPDIEYDKWIDQAHKAFAMLDELKTKDMELWDLWSGNTEDDFFSNHGDTVTLSTGETITLDELYEKNKEDSDYVFFEKEDFDYVGNSRLTDINIATLLTIGFVEGGLNFAEENKYDGGLKDLYNAHEGRDLLRYSSQIESASEFWGDTSFGTIELQPATVVYTLREYQGKYHGGGEFSAIEDGHLNHEVFTHWNPSVEEIWLARSDRFYNAFTNLAENNPEYAYLLDNLITT